MMNAENRSKLSELIEKINWLHKNLMRTNKNDINPLEADLMLSYLEEMKAVVNYIKSEIPEEVGLRYEDLPQTSAQNAHELSTDGPPISLNGYATDSIVEDNDQRKTVNDKFLENTEGSNLRKEKTIELSDKIDLNQKIGFIQELFNQDESAFTNILQQFWQFKSYREGFEFLEKNLKPRLHTDLQEKAYERFIKLWSSCFC